MDRPAVGERKRALEATSDQAADHLAEGFFELCPGGSGITTHRHGAERLIVEMKVDIGRVDLAGFDDIGEIFACVLAPEHGIER